MARAASADSGAPLRPRARLFERRRGTQHGDVVEAPSDDLKPDRQAGLREPARHGRRRLARHVEDERERASRVAPDLYAADLRRIELPMGSGEQATVGMRSRS